MTVFSPVAATKFEPRGHVPAALHSHDRDRPPEFESRHPAASYEAQWSSGRILALGARDPRFEPGLGPSLFLDLMRSFQKLT